jgi:hypothetical protein
MGVLLIVIIIKNSTLAPAWQSLEPFSGANIHIFVCKIKIFLNYFSKNWKYRVNQQVQVCCKVRYNV